MINQKLKKTFIQSISIYIAVILSMMSVLAMLPVEAFASTLEKAALLNYNVSVTVNGEGSLYWDYGKDMEFFLEDGVDTYNPDCKIKSQMTYKFSKVFDRGLLPQPEKKSYFAGFYGTDGKKIKLKETAIDILRVKVDGVYFYDYYDAYENAKFKNYTESAYKDLVKTYLKKLYGTSRYKVMKTVSLYEVPKKDAAYEARFLNKKTPNLSVKTTLNKTYGNKQFYVISSRPSKYTYAFKTSNKNVLTIDKKTGYATIQGPGIAKVTCTIAETETTLAQTYTTTVTVQPEKVKKFKAKQEKKKLNTSWAKQGKNSGYEIQVANNKSFATILASKTVRSSQSTSTTVTLKKELFNNYARIRAYKTSNGKKIYGSYTVVKISH